MSIVHRIAGEAPLEQVAAVEALIAAAPNWRSMLRHGLEAGGIGEEGEDVADLIEARLRTGRPLAAQDWIERQEAATGRRMRPAKPGPKSTAPSPNGATSRKYASTPNS